MPTIPFPIFGAIGEQAVSGVPVSQLLWIALAQLSGGHADYQWLTPQDGYELLKKRTGEIMQSPFPEHHRAPRMRMPKRIQRKRTKGWKMPPGAVYVGRPTEWGSPFKALRGASLSEIVAAFRIWIKDKPWLRSERIREHLRGKDLACWCPLCPKHRDGRPFDEPCDACPPCHADVLGEIANA